MLEKFFSGLCKNPRHNINKSNPVLCKNNSGQGQLRFISKIKMSGWFSSQNSNHVIQHKWNKEQSNIIITIDESI